MTLEQFRKAVDALPQNERGCKLWRKRKPFKNTGRYAVVVIGGKKVYVHRLAFEVFKGPIPGGMWVLHHCDNPPCCNHEHLYAGMRKYPALVFRGSRQ